MSTFKGTIAKKPIVRDKVIFSAIKTDNADKPTQLVLFKDKIDNKFVELLASLNLGDQVTVAGKMQKNKLNNETEISIAEIYAGDVKPQEDKYAVNAETDFNIGSETEYGTITLVERKNAESYYTDGEMYWYEKSTLKCPTSF
jgi:aspartyl/asparaginyl-tRNA synthetase